MAKVGCILQIGILFASLDISYSPGQLKQMLIKHKAIRIIGEKKEGQTQTLVWEVSISIPVLHFR